MVIFYSVRETLSCPFPWHNRQIVEFFWLPWAAIPVIFIMVCLVVLCHRLLLTKLVQKLTSVETLLLGANGIKAYSKFD